MKKSLLNLTVAIATFFCGVLVANFFLVEQELIYVLPPVEERKVEIIEINEIPFSKIEPSKESEKIEVEEESNDQSFGGWYRLNNYRKMPEVNMIRLSRDYGMNDDNTSSEKIVPSAGVFTYLEKYGDQGYIDDAWTIINGNKVKFKTNKIKGIEYRFKGTFFKNKTTGKEGEEVLRGTLQKFVKDKKVAEVTGNFAYYEPRCWQ